MSKYVDILADIEGQFNLQQWKALNISAFPANFRIPKDLSEFVKLEVLPLRSNTDYGRFGIEGIVYVQIYVPANQGLKRLMEIADTLDSLLENKTMFEGTTTSESTMQVLGLDTDNPDLFRGDYAIDFKFYN